MFKLLDETIGGDIHDVVLPCRPSPFPPGPEGLHAMFARLLCSPSRAHLLIRDQAGERDTAPPDAPGPAPVTATPPAAAPVAV